MSESDRQPKVGTKRTLFGSFGSNALWQLIQTVSATGSEVVVLLILAAVLSPQEFGHLVVALSGSKIVFLLLEPRIHEFLIPRLARYAGKSRKGAWGFVRWSRARELRCNTVAVCICLLAGWLFPVMPFGIKGELLAASGAYVFAGTLMKFSSLAIFRCLSLVRIAALVAAAVGAAKLGLLAIGVRVGLSPGSLLLLMAIPALLAAVGSALTADRLLKSSIGPSADLSREAHLNVRNRRTLGRILLHNYATGLMEIGHRELDVQILAWLAGPVEAGRYRLAKTLAMSMLEALSPVLLVLLPELSRRISMRAQGGIRAFIRRIMLLMGTIGLMAGVAVAAISMLYVRWYSPEQADALIPTFVLLAGFVLIAPGMWSQPYLVAIGRPDVYVLGSAIGAAFGVVAAFALVPSLGGVGAAIANLSGLFVVTAVALRYALTHAGSTLTRDET